MSNRAQAQAAQAAAAARRTGVVQSPLRAMAQQQQAQRAKQVQAVRDVQKQVHAKNLKDMSVEEFLSKPAAKQQQAAAQKHSGLLGKVLGNPVVSGALAPLKYLQYPMKGVVGVAEEAGDAVNGQGFSFNDIVKHIQDPKYGFGTLAGKIGLQAHTGNHLVDTWANRGIGLAGDLVADPFSYLTFGANKFVGSAGRAALATQAAREFGDKLAPAELENLLGRIGTAGEYGLSKAEREALGVGPASIRFAGKPIPGTEALAQGAGDAMAAARRPFTDTVLGRGARALGGARSGEIRDAVNRLATNGEDLVGATAKIAATSADQAAERRFIGELGPAARDLAKQVRGRDDLVHSIEAKFAAGHALNSEEQQLVDHFAHIGKEAQGRGLSGLTLRQGYAGPQLQTEELRTFLRGKNADNFIDKLDTASGRTLGRKFKPGTFEIGGKKITLKTATRAEIDSVLKKTFPELADKKLFITDPAVLLHHSVQGLSGDVGKVAGINELAKFGEAIPHADPRAWTMGAAGPEQRAVDTAAVARAKTAVADASKDFAVDSAGLRSQGQQALDQLGLPHDPTVPRPRAFRDQSKELDHFEQRMVDHVATLDPADPSTHAAKQVVDNYVAAKAMLPPKMDKVFDSRKMLSEAKTGTLTQPIKLMVRDGFDEIGKSLMGDANSVAVRAELNQGERNLAKAMSNPNKFWKTVDGYTHFFKAWATATPGFHVRNAMSATFMNSVAGVTPASMLKGAQIWKAFRGDTEGDWWKGLKGVDEKMANDVVHAVYASGAGGQFSAAELGTVSDSSSKVVRAADKLTHNKVTDSSAAWGERVEGAVRSAMAYDVMKNGGTLDEAIYKIKKFHFDYSEVNELDTQMKRLVPFWTFMSRNIPLQVQMMWTNPRIYSQYESFKRNMNIDPEGAMTMPLGIGERGGFRVTDGLALAPDLPQTRVTADLERLGDPVRMLSQANPLLRVPAELIAHRNFQNDYPLDKQPTKLSKELEFLRLFPGLTQTAGNGDTVIDQRIPYAIRNLLPLAGNVNRLGGTDDYYASRVPQSIANFLGIPINQLTPEVIQRELKRQESAKKKAGKTDPYLAALQNFAG